MLELYHKYPEVLKRLRSGVLGDETDRIAAANLLRSDLHGIRERQSGQ